MIALVAWIAAAVFAVAVLGYCGWELAWRARRLHRDLDGMRELAVRAAALQADLADARRRLTAARQG